MRVVISEFMDPAAVAALAARFETACDADLGEHRDKLKRLLTDADALIVRNKTQVDGELLAAAPQLKVVGRLGVGLDNIDVLQCKSHGIEVIPATGANALAVAEYVIAAALILLRGAYSSTEAVAAGKWPRAELASGRELARKTLGVIGFGQIGQLTGRLARALGMKVIAVTRSGKAAAPADAAYPVERIDEALPLADYLIVTTPTIPLNQANDRHASVSQPRFEAYVAAKNQKYAVPTQVH